MARQLRSSTLELKNRTRETGAANETVLVHGRERNQSRLIDGAQDRPMQIRILLFAIAIDVEKLVGTPRPVCEL